MIAVVTRPPVAQLKGVEGRTIQDEERKIPGCDRNTSGSKPAAGCVLGRAGDYRHAHSTATRRGRATPSGAAQPTAVTGGAQPTSAAAGAQTTPMTGGAQATPVTGGAQATPMPTTSVAGARATPMATSAPAASAATSAPLPKVSGTVRIMTVWGGAELDAFRQVASGWEQETGGKVEVEIHP